MTSADRTTAEREAPGAPAGAPNGRPRQAAPGAVTTAVLFATAPAGDGGPAAALAWQGTTLIGRLLDQLAALGVRDAHVITRAEWVAALEPLVDGHPLSVRLQPSPDLASDLRAAAAVAAREPGGLVVANADVLTQDEVLAGLLADPRVASGALATTVRKVQRQMAFRMRGRRGRIVSAGSPYHYVHQPNATFLGVLKVAPAHREALAGVAVRLAELVDGELPDGWRDELDAKAGRWKLALHRRARVGLPADDADEEQGEAPVEDDSELAAEGSDVELSPADDAELRRRLAAAERDAPSLLLCGLVRSDVQVGTSHLRKLFWTRPLTPEDIADAAARIGEHDEDKALLDSAVKANDGFFTTHFVSPYSKYIARWAARRGWTPNGVTTISVAVGFMAAAAFATGERAGLIAGAILLQAAFTLDCVDGQLARYTRTFSKFGAWLDSVFDRTKEYAVFAGLAIGAARTGGDVWLLAGAALALQTFRHSIDFSYPAAQHQAMAAARQPPIEQVQDVIAAKLPAPARARGRGARGAGRRRRADAQAARARRLAPDRPLAPRPLGQEGDRVPDRRALRRDLDHRRAVRRARDVHRPARLGRVRGALHDRRPRAALARAARAGLARARARAPRPARSRPTATTARSRCCSGGSAVPAPASALVLAGLAVPAVALIVARRRRVVGARRRHARLPRAARRDRERPPAARPHALGRAARAARGRVRRDALDRRGRGRRAGRVRAALRDHVPPLRHRLPAAPARRDAAALARPRWPAAGTAA